MAYPIHEVLSNCHAYVSGNCTAATYSMVKRNTHAIRGFKEGIFLIVLLLKTKR